MSILKAISSPLSQTQTEFTKEPAADFGHLLQHLQNVEDLKKKSADSNAQAQDKNVTSADAQDEIRALLEKMEGIPQDPEGENIDSDWEDVKGLEFRKIEKLIQRCVLSVVFCTNFNFVS